LPPWCCCCCCCCCKVERGRVLCVRRRPRKTAACSHLRTQSVINNSFVLACTSINHPLLLGLLAGQKLAPGLKIKMFPIDNILGKSQESALNQLITINFLNLRLTFLLAHRSGRERERKRCTTGSCAPSLESGRFYFMFFWPRQRRLLCVR